MSDNKLKNKQIKDSVSGKKKTEITINSANMINNADGQLFPSLYAQVQSTMGLDIIQLGFITGVRNFAQSITTPVWGWWSDRFSRRKVLAGGCFLWAIFTTLMAFSVQYIDLFIYRLITGIGLAVIIPTTQSLIADYYPPEKRGTAFGWLGLTGIIGVILGTIFATALVTGTKYIMGIDSWRFVFLIWGFLSIIMGFLILIFAKDPIRGEMEPELAGKITREKAEEYKIQKTDFKKILKNKTFILIVLQGISGTIPWNGILFMIIWFEYIGFDPLTAGLMFSLIAIGAAFGTLLGGWIGDKAARWKPKTGRIIIAQISVFSGIPLTLVIFLLIPMTPGSMMLYIIFGAITGLLISWCGGGCNNPIFSEIFEPEIRSTAFSIDRVFEGSVGALGTILVGLAAAFFGYQTPPLGADISSLSNELRMRNMVALAYGMFLVALIPWILCLILYTLVYKTYYKDAEQMRKVLEQRART
jgi:MFS family permease